LSIQTIITAAGDSRARFFGAGFAKPKSLVQIKGTNVVEKAIRSYTVDFSHLTVAINQEEDAEWGVAAEITRAFPSANIVRVSSQARGALASALLSISKVNPDLPLVVAAGDSQVTSDVGGILSSFQSEEFAAATIVFDSSGARWSYVAVDRRNKVLEVSEKFQIGSLATTGFFYFQSAKSFIEAARWVLLNNAQVDGNFYVSTTLNFLISRGEKVGFQKIQSSEYRSWSLPIDFVEEDR
jgi:CTP:molybdopterin cytidylyltransferase MocA